MINEIEQLYFSNHKKNQESTMDITFDVSADIDDHMEKQKDKIKEVIACINESIGTELQNSGTIHETKSYEITDGSVEQAVRVKFEIIHPQRNQIEKAKLDAIRGLMQSFPRRIEQLLISGKENSCCHVESSDNRCALDKEEMMAMWNEAVFDGSINEWAIIYEDEDGCGKMIQYAGCAYECFVFEKGRFFKYDFTE